MAEYLVVARGGAAERRKRSPEELQKLTEHYIGWTVKLREAGKLKGSNRLQDDGRVLRPNGAKPTVTDGPFSEANEAIGGYWVLEAGDYDEALKLVQDHPHLHLWKETALEVRQVFDMSAYAR
jgi:hypothetical protein